MTRVDTAWWIWQSLKPSERTAGPKALMGTNTFLNVPPSANTTYEDVIELGYAAGPPRQIKNLMSTTSGPFCYVYV
jgi:tyrosinase